MSKKLKFAVMLLMALFLTGCAMTTVDRMYSPPKRSAAYEDLQRAIDMAMEDMEYASPLSGENRQTVQMADLDGDGQDEYLLFARNTSDNPMKIFIFRRDEGGCSLMETIESRGSAFDLVEYADMDGMPGMELVVGRQVSETVLRSVSVYKFREGNTTQMLSTNYSKIVVADMDADNLMDLLIISSGESDADNAVASLYRYANGEVVRSRQASLSARSEFVKRIMVGRLQNGTPAVYVASTVADSAIITDVFALKDGAFTNVSFSNDSGTSVQTLRNYYVYADDIDDDGVLELPDLIDMVPVENTWMTSNQKLVRWYAMDLNGNETDKMFTFHNFDSGWYLQLDQFLTPRISVVRQDNSFIFYLWDEEFHIPQPLMRIHAISGHDREAQATERGYYVLHRTEGILYAVETEAIAIEHGLIPELLADSFHPIQMDWKNGET